jgi:hypothetical protein
LGSFFKKAAISGLRSSLPPRRPAVLAFAGAQSAGERFDHGGAAGLFADIDVLAGIGAVIVLQLMK